MREEKQVNQFARTQMLLGAEGMDKLVRARVAVFGIGGVGGHTAEALARSGIGALDIIDDDRVCLSNLNRQIIATHSSIGREKTQVMKERLLDINPALKVGAIKAFYLPQTADTIDLSVYDYVVDAVDTVKAKLELICRCRALGVRIISAMGAGNKLDPTRLKVADIFQTDICPLARVMRSELRKCGIPALKVVYSTEEALKPAESEPPKAENSERCQSETMNGQSSRRAVPGSTAFVPSVMGLIMAAEVVRDIAQTGDVKLHKIKQET